MAKGYVIFVTWNTCALGFHLEHLCVVHFAPFWKDIFYKTSYISNPVNFFKYDYPLLQFMDSYQLHNLSDIVLKKAQGFQWPKRTKARFLKMLIVALGTLVLSAIHIIDLEKSGKIRLNVTPVTPVTMNIKHAVFREFCH